MEHFEHANKNLIGVEKRGVEEVDLLKAMEQLFEAHAPETLMAFFGAGTSILLFYLVVTVLRQLFGLQKLTAGQEIDQDQATGALIEALVTALVSEVGQLRTTMDGILRETLQRGEESAAVLSGLATRTDQLPHDVVSLLKPKFEGVARVAAGGATDHRQGPRV